VSELSEKLLEQDVITDMRAGLRTKEILAKHGLSLTEFEQLLRRMIRNGSFTKEEYRNWKARRSSPETVTQAPETIREHDPKKGKIVETFVIEDPEKNHAWALQLFSTKRDAMKGANFKVVLHGRKYSFVVEEMLFRGSVSLRFNGEEKRKPEKKGKREEAMEYITKYGWAAFLEARAFAANFDEDVTEPPQQARLVVLHCRNDTFLAALHTPAPAISFYVSSSLESVIERLARSIDTSALKIPQ